MTINGNNIDGTLTVAPIGRLDSSTSGEFGEFLEKNLTDEVKKLVFDFTGVDYLSSKGLRVIVLCYKKLAGRPIEVTGCNDAVREILRLSDFLELFNVR